MNREDTLLLNHLGQFISDHKKELVDAVLKQRTRHITVVLDDIHNSQNASAAIRTCECFGIQDIHIVEGVIPYKVNPYVLKGSKKWLDLKKYSSSANGPRWYTQLKESGYRIVATAPSAKAISIHEVDVKEKIAVVFGNELHGVSDETLHNADVCVSIPMVGFTESFNISASVAICLSTWITKIKELRLEVGLSREEMEKIKLDWFRAIVKRSDLIETEFLRSIR